MSASKCGRRMCRRSIARNWQSGEPWPCARVAGRRSDTEPIAKSVQHPVHLIVCQPAELSLQFNGGNCLELLKVKCARFKERLRNVQFPTISTERRCVQENGN